MTIRWPFMVAGLVIAFALLVFIDKVEFLGSVCYAIGEFNLFGNTRCLKPFVYWGAWFVAAVLVLAGIGVASPFLPRQPQHPNGSTVTQPANPTAQVEWNRVKPSLYFILYAIMALALFVYLLERNKDGETRTVGAFDTLERSTLDTASSNQRSINNVTVPSVDAKVAERVEPSFACARATYADERTICASEALTAFERAMAAIVSELKAKQSDKQRDHTKTMLRSFLKQRRACGADAECIGAVLNRQIGWAAKELSEPSDTVRP